MSQPSNAPDGWWLAVLWVADAEGVIPFWQAGPAAGPPPDPPLARLGPAVAGALSGRSFLSVLLAVHADAPLGRQPAERRFGCAAW